MNIKEIKEVADLDIIVNNVLDNDNITPELPPFSLPQQYPNFYPIT